MFEVKQILNKKMLQYLHLRLLIVQPYLFRMLKNQKVEK